MITLIGGVCGGRQSRDVGPTLKMRVPEKFSALASRHDISISSSPLSMEFYTKEIYQYEKHKKYFYVHEHLNPFSAILELERGFIESKNMDLQRQIERLQGELRALRCILQGYQK